MALKLRANHVVKPRHAVTIEVHGAVAASDEGPPRNAGIIQILSPNTLKRV